MSPGVRLRNGIEVEFENGETFALDGASEDATTVLSHAHGDHLVRGTSGVVASELTAALAAVRTGADVDVVDHPAIELFDAGHVAGSRAAKLTDPDTGRTYLYTGDCSTRDRFFLEGFDPVEADVLVIETTYGKPEYTFPPTDAVVAEVTDWLAETMDRVAVLFGYALGRAQTLQRIVADSPRSGLFVPDDVADLNAVIERHRDVSFGARRLDGDVDLEPGDAIVAPSARSSRVRPSIEEHDAVTAGFSGWAADRSFVYRRGVDEGFVLSDHCDFEELVGVVEAVDPDQVYTNHGFDDAFADYLTTKRGYEARALKRNQTTLADF